MPLRGRAKAAVVVAAIALGAVAVPASSGSEQSRRATAKVTVADDYFAPTGLEIRKGSKVKWVWDDSNTNTHNVILTGTHPKGVKRSDYRSSSGAVGLTFKRTFEVKGRYVFVCAFHKSQMKFDLQVKK